MTSQVPGAPQRMAAGPGKALEMMGEAGQQIAQTIEKASLLQETTKAENFLDQRLRDIQNRAGRETDVSDETMQKYVEEADKAVHDSAQAITIPAARDMFHQKSLSRADISKTNIQNNFLKQKISVGKEQLDVYMGNRLDDFLQSNNPGDKQRAVLDRDKKIDQAIEAGYITTADAVKMRNALEEEWATAQVEYDISVDPDLAVDLLESNSYKDIKAQERQDLLSLAKSAKKKRDAENERALKERQSQSEEEMISMDIEETLTLRNLNEFRGRVSEKVYRAQLNKLKSAKTVDPIVKATSFNSLQDEFVSLVIMDKKTGETKSSFDQISNFRANVIEAMGKGEITQSDGQGFLKDVSVAFSKEADAKAKRDVNNKHHAGEHFWNFLTFWTNELGGEVDQRKMELMRDYNNRIDSGESPEKAKAEIIVDEQKRMNPNRSAYEMAQVIETPNGPAKVVGWDTDGEPLVEFLNNGR